MPEHRAAAVALTSSNWQRFSQRFNWRPASCELITAFGLGEKRVRHLRFRVQPICGYELKQPTCHPATLFPLLSIFLPHRVGVTFRIQFRKPNLIEPGASRRECFARNCERCEMRLPLFTA